MRAVCYARVSSAAQRERDTIAAQVRDLPAFVERQGWQLVRPVETYVDDGRSAKAGRLDARAGLAALLRDAALGVFDVVCVVDVDRLTRSEDLAERGAILGAFQRAGVRIASANTGQVLDLSSSSGDLFSGLAAFFAAEENRKRRDRTIAGKVTALARGRKPAGPTPYGWAYDRATGTWSVREDQAAIIREIFARAIAGESCEQIGRDLDRRAVPRPRGGYWQRERVWSILTRRDVVGTWTADRRTRTTIAIPPIIDDVTWQRAQHVLEAQGRRGLRRTRHLYLLEAIAVCGACGARVGIRSGTPARGLVPAYVCGHRRTPPRGGARCVAPIVPTAETDARVWAAVCRELDDPDLGAALARRRAERAATHRDWSADADRYRAHLARLDRVEASHLARYRRGGLSDFALDLELAALGRERAAVRQQLATAEQAQGRAAGAEARQARAEDVLATLRARLASATPEQRRHVLAALVEPRGVVLRGRRVVITLVVPTAAAASLDGPGAVDQARAAGCIPERVGGLRVRVVA